jgi:hypothetical protein
MKRFTVSVPEDFKAKLDLHPEINWPEVMKAGIIRRLEVLEKLDAKGKL